MTQQLWSVVRYDTTPLGLGKNWITDNGGLDPFHRAIAHALMRSGHDESSAIQIALGSIKRWAAGGGNVTAKTRAKAAKALARWEELRAKARATPNKRSTGHPAIDSALAGVRDGFVMETGSAGLLIPKAPGSARHVFAPSPKDKKKCKICGEVRLADTHSGTRGVDAVEAALREAGVRHAGPEHHSVPTGHLTASRRKTLNQVHGQADTLEPAVQRAMVGLFQAQAKATLDRLKGRRGKAMLRAAQQPPEDDQPAPLMDAGQIYDLAYWAARIRDTLDPLLGAVKSMTADRFAGQLGDHQVEGSLAAVQQALDERLTRLAATVSQTTLNDVSNVLRDGVVNGQTIGQMTQSLEKLFSEAEQVRAPMIARTETIGALNQAAATYAESQPPDVIAGREWLAAHDSRVRPTHVVADGQVRAMGEPYIVGETPMMFPHDPMAPPGETINCRCTQAFLTPSEYAKRAQHLPAAKTVAA